MKHQLFAHNIGFDRPRLTHSEWIDYLYRCASDWNALVPDQALQVQKQAIQAEKMRNSCAVCRAARA